MITRMSLASGSCCPVRLRCFLGLRSSAIHSNALENVVVWCPQTGVLRKVIVYGGIARAVVPYVVILHVVVLQVVVPDSAFPACRSPPRRSRSPYCSCRAHSVQQCLGPVRQSMLCPVVRDQNHEQKNDLRTYKELIWEPHPCGALRPTYCKTGYFGPWAPRNRNGRLQR
jgi:hypothetical protein